jgi:hypothetical protein
MNNGNLEFSVFDGWAAVSTKWSGDTGARPLMFGAVLDAAVTTISPVARHELLRDVLSLSNEFSRVNDLGGGLEDESDFPLIEMGDLKVPYFRDRSWNPDSTSSKLDFVAQCKLVAGSDRMGATTKFKSWRKATDENMIELVFAAWDWTALSKSSAPGEIALSIFLGGTTALLHQEYLVEGKKIGPGDRGVVFAEAMIVVSSQSAASD